MAQEPKPKKPRTTSTARAGARKSADRLASAAPTQIPSSLGDGPKLDERADTEPSRQPPQPAVGVSSPSGEIEPERALHDRIQERAYFLFVSSGCQHGHALDHWLIAEREVGSSAAESSSAGREQLDTSG